MSIAVTKGKISRTGTNLTNGSEDLLTASVFGPVRYLPSEKLLLPILRKAKNLDGNSYIPPIKIPDSDISIDFWPKHEKSEPDLSISFSEKELVFIESKFKAGKSGSFNSDENLGEEESNESASSDQLSREFMDLCDNSYQKNTLIYLTAHRIMPKLDIESSAQAYAKLNNRDDQIFKENTYWLSWYDVWFVARQRLPKESNQFYRVLIRDIKELLERQQLKHFTGFSEKSLIESLTNPIFYGD